MTEPLIQSTGFSSCGFEAPSFDLWPGEAVCLHLPHPMAAPFQIDALIDILTGRTPAPGFRIAGRVRMATPARPARGLFRLFRRQTALAWLRAARPGSGHDLEVALRRIGIAGDEHVDRLAGTAKTLLGLEAVWVSLPDVVLFSTQGLDPLGTDRVLAEVVKHLDPPAAIYLSVPYLQDGRVHWQHMPRGRCLQVLAKSPTSAPARHA